MQCFKIVLSSVISLLFFNACSDSNTAITADVEDVADTQDIQTVDVPVVGTDAVFDDTFHCLNNGQCDDGNPCTQDQCYNGGEKPVCKYYPNPNVACDDGNACTVSDVCVAQGSTGVCFGQPMDCDDKNVCTTDNCVVASGCVHTADDGVKCDDGTVCTINDTCAVKLCVGATISCDDGNECTADSCDKVTGCVHSFLDQKCNDKSACTEGDWCALEGINSVCKGTKVNVSDNNPCTFDSCDPVTGISHVASVNGILCQDGNACTVGDHCVNSACVAGSTTKCDQGVCTVGTCNTGTGVCDYVPSAASYCDDGSLCTSNDHCSSGKCVGVTVQCNDGNDCTGDSCIPATGCFFQNLDKNPCNDGNFCTNGDVCFGNACLGVVQTCEDNNPCTVDSCNPSTGYCSHTSNDGYYCDDGNACTMSDECSGTTCTGLTINCDDKNSCTSDSCNPKTGCFHTFVLDIACDDGNACTTSDKCTNNAVCIGKPTLCDDGNKCTTDSCNTTSGCVFSAPTPGCIP